ncbi:hypothetical protein XSR1_100051 [Xenorhabdus szentirmaii DSM 16338]|uniref:Uncharacterized protein n=1 Tax=Xenorhabdus szentirmaii DSM 16338 TaxID=1427518 RepID=W1IRA5_9GAMM|nr:hypothetical protein XSR1_100051 [Xenorhabdus szentirmaii DSM 16338]
MCCLILPVKTDRKRLNAIITILSAYCMIAGGLHKKGFKSVYSMLCGVIVRIVGRVTSSRKQAKKSANK